MIITNQQSDVHIGVRKILEANGFECLHNGDLVRRSTGCKFSFADIIKHESVMDFQLKWGYA